MRIMRQHNVLRQEAMTSRVEAERVRVASSEHDSKEYRIATQYFLRNLRNVQNSEENIINSCKTLLDSMP